jgi:hypothetical protein
LTNAMGAPEGYGKRQSESGDMSARTVGSSDLFYSSCRVLSGLASGEFRREGVDRATFFEQGIKDVKMARRRRACGGRPRGGSALRYEGR